MTRNYAEQLEHLDHYATLIGEHKNIAIARWKDPIEFTPWLEQASELLNELDDPEAKSIWLREGQELISGGLSDEGRFEKGVSVLGEICKYLRGYKTELRIGMETHIASDIKFEVGNGEFELRVSGFYVDGERIKMAPQEHQLIEIIMERQATTPEASVSASEIAQKIWGDSLFTYKVSRLISNINAKLPEKNIRRSGALINPSSGNRVSMYKFFTHEELKRR